MFPIIVASIVGVALGACLVLSIGRSLSDYGDPHDWEVDDGDQ